jgi:glycosyltransferase involved in cell wall biosynthesis/GT2 family glycosyltransferase
VSRFSIAIPVKNGARYLEEVLSAAQAQGADEVLVIDSGSDDGSLKIAASAGVEVVNIERGDFGHGRTRNLAMERTSGDHVAFITQDATPCSGWLQAYLDAFALADDVGAAYGPHLPRPGTSPMIARELTEFFRTFSPDGRAQIQHAGDPSFLSNVNACYDRRCWEEIRFRDVDYSEDQAFGVDLLAAGWAKVYQPAAQVLHAHDYGFTDFMRRYFDEYRGLRSTVGHIEPFGMRAALRYTAAEVAGDRRWMSEHGVGGKEAARWLTRSALHHTGRKIFAALGSRTDRLPESVRTALSLEREEAAAAAGAQPGASAPLPSPVHVRAALGESNYEPVVRVWSEGPARLVEPPPGLADRRRLRLAMVIPPFSRGSGGHNTLLQLLLRFERRGHVCSVWVHDYGRTLDNVWPGVLRHNLREHYAPIEGSVHRGFDDWHGADVVIATGWETVHPALMLPNCHARAYIVNDHEPEFFAASTQQQIAIDTYRHGLHCIAASPWLRDLLIDRYGASADAFQLGVDHAEYHPRPTGRRGDTVIYYARYQTPRRAVPVGLAALQDLHRRRPDVRIVLFGTDKPLSTTFPFEHMGILNPHQLSWLYSNATVGLCLSLTNFSLMPKEMLACGLPCVELAGVSAESIFGDDGPIELAPLHPGRIADALERLLEDHELWETRSKMGIQFVASHTWDHAANQVEAGLRHALRLHEAAAVQPL